MAKIPRGKNLKDWKTPRPPAGVGKLRIIGGQFRGRQIAYSGDPVTRPMKDHVREAAFNLFGGYVKGKAAIDLFAGTGAMGLEAISRGATRAMLVERHIPTVKIIQQNIRSLGDDLDVQVDSADTFFWVRQFLKDSSRQPTEPWVVMCCPPYAFYVDRQQELLTMLDSLIEAAPPESVFFVESDERFDPELLSDSIEWASRKYVPAIVTVGRKID